MPGIFLAAALLWGALTGSALTDREGYRPGKNKFGKKGKVEYVTKTSSMNHLKDGSCEFMFFAYATRGHKVELLVDGLHRYGPNTAFSYRVVVPQNSSVTFEVDFIDPWSGEPLAHHRIRELCWNDPYYDQR